MLEERTSVPLASATLAFVRCDLQNQEEPSALAQICAASLNNDFGFTRNDTLMARQPVPREDLIRDAVALADRIEFVHPVRQDRSSTHGLLADVTAILVGFRHDGSASVYFDQEPVYQFDARWAMRRAFVAGPLKAKAGRLIRLNKRHEGGKLRLDALPMSEAEQEQFLGEAHHRLHQLHEALRTGELRVSRQVALGVSDVAIRVREWLEQMPYPLSVAESLSRS